METFSVLRRMELYSCPTLDTRSVDDLPVLTPSILVVSIQSVQPKRSLNIRLYNINIFLQWLTYRFISDVTKHPEEINIDFLKSDWKVKLHIHPHIFNALYCF
jgi:hypothetical protein